MPLIIVASHHKAGSTYAKKCFYEIASVLKCDYHFYGFDEAPEPLTPSNSKNKILCFSHARYEHIAATITRLTPEHYRLVHIVRDPRTLIVSATKYHRDADEHWLSIQKSDYGNKSYQQYISSLPSYSYQLIFEMKNGSRGALEEMGKIHNSRLATITIKLEDISWDRSGLTHQQVSEHLVDDIFTKNTVKSILMKYSLFSLPTPPRHARTMLSADTRAELKDDSLLLYYRMYGNLHSILGYEA